MMKSKRMIRKQVYLDPQQNSQIKKLSSLHDKTESEIIRDAINEYLVNTKLDSKDPLHDLIGMVEKGSEKGSTHHDTDIYLSEESGTHEKK